MTKKLSPLSLLALLVPFLAAPRAWAGERGVPPGTTPVAGPVEVFVNMGTDTASQGGFVVADVVVVNSSTELTVRGSLRAALTFADGTVQRLRLPQPLILEPDSAIILQAFLPVPTDAALGEATFAAAAVVGFRPAPGEFESHVARDADTFEVVAP